MKISAAAQDNFLQVFGQEGLRGAQDNTGDGFAFGCLQKLDGKTLLLRHHSLQIQETERQTLTVWEAVSL